MPEQTSPSEPLDIRQNGDRWECRPTGVMTQFGFLLFFVAGAFTYYLSGFFLLNSGIDPIGLGFGGLLFLFASVATWQGFRFWRLRRVPLTIETTGRVSYNDKELCPAGSVRSLQIVPDLREGHGDCKILLELNDSRRVDLEGPYFDSVATREDARLLAGEMAKVLHVEVVEREN